MDPDRILATFKILIIGESGVGKSSLMLRFTENDFDSDQALTIGVDFKTKMLDLDGVKVKLAIWDTAGQERFRSITQSYYRSASALILVYDISCQPTFDCLPDWLREIQEHANSKVLKILVGNKTDRDDREIPQEVGAEFAKQHGMYFLETSAKQADNVERLFYDIAAVLIEQARTKEFTLRSETSVLTNLSQKTIYHPSCCSIGDRNHARSSSTSDAHYSDSSGPGSIGSNSGNFITQQ